MKAKELPDGEVPPPTADGNFIIGPTHNPSPDTIKHDGVPEGTVYEFTMESKDSKFYPGLLASPGLSARPDPNDPKKLIVYESSGSIHAETRGVCAQTVCRWTVAPFIVGADGPDRTLFTALDNLIAQHRVPVMIAISIGNGSGDAQGSERGLEYDTMSGLYAEFVEKEVLPLVEKTANVKLTKDPDGAGDHGRKFRRIRCVEHGLVSPGVVSPRADLLGNVRQPAVAV